MVKGLPDGEITILVLIQSSEIRRLIGFFSRFVIVIEETTIFRGQHSPFGLQRLRHFYLNAE